MELHLRLSICKLGSLDRPLVLQTRNARLSYKFRALCAPVCLSVCLSVCLLLDSTEHCAATSLEPLLLRCRAERNWKESKEVLLSSSGVKVFCVPPVSIIGMILIYLTVNILVVFRTQCPWIRFIND